MLAVAIQFLPLLILAGAGYFIFQQTTDSFEAVLDEMFGKMMPIIHLNDDLHRAAMPVNDYLITGDRAEQASYLIRAGIVDRKFEALIGAWQGEGDRKALEVILAAKDQWQAAKQLAVRIFALQAGGQAMLAPDLMHRFDARVYAAIDQLDGLHKRVHATIGKQRLLVKADKQKVQYLIVGIFASAVFISLLVVWFFFRRILSSLQIIEQGAEAFGAGNFSHRIQLDTEDELGRLVRRFNEMADRLEEIATRDGLTGLYNKQEILRLLEMELNRARRYHSRLSLMMLDLDHFKQINDSYGHQAGDIALGRVAELLTRHVRGIDHVGRYGGEEFCIVLPETSEIEAMEIAERIRRHLQEEPIQLGKGKVISLAISIGIAVFPQDATVGEKLIACADEALYQAKKEGRNKVKKYRDLV